MRVGSVGEAGGLTSSASPPANVPQPVRAERARTHRRAAQSKRKRAPVSAAATVARCSLLAAHCLLLLTAECTLLARSLPSGFLLRSWPALVRAAGTQLSRKLRAVALRKAPQQQPRTLLAAGTHTEQHTLKHPQRPVPIPIPIPILSRSTGQSPIASAPAAATALLLVADAAGSSGSSQILSQITHSPTLSHTHTHTDRQTDTHTHTLTRTQPIRPPPRL